MKANLIAKILKYLRAKSDNFREPISTFENYFKQLYVLLESVNEIMFHLKNFIIDKTKIFWNTQIN